MNQQPFLLCVHNVATDGRKVKVKDLKVFWQPTWISRPWFLWVKIEAVLIKNPKINVAKRI